MRLRLRRYLLPAILAGGLVHASVERKVYKATPERELHITLEVPDDGRTSDGRPAMVFFQNVGWNQGVAPLQFKEQVAYLTARGMVCVHAEYREKGPEGVTSQKCMDDVYSAMLWLRQRAGEFGIDPGRIAAGAGSGSLHLVTAALILDSDRRTHVKSPSDLLPDALFLFNPDLDVIEPGLMQRVLSPVGEGANKLPPTVILYGSDDVLAPHLSELVARCALNGLPVEKSVFPGGLHGFFKFSPGLEKSLQVLDQRFQSLGYLKAEPRIEMSERRRPVDYNNRMLTTQQRWLTRHMTIEERRLRPDADSVPWPSFVYKRSGPRQLAVGVHYPPKWKKSDRRPAVIFFGGGGFNPRDSKTGEPYPIARGQGQDGVRPPASDVGGSFRAQARHFARRDAVTFRIEYRRRKTDGVLPDTGLEDAFSVMRWVRQNSVGLGIDPQRVVAAGGSSGGHLAAGLASLTGFDASSDDRSISPVPDALILYYPLLDFLEGGTKSQTFLSALNGDRELAQRISPLRHWSKEMPPTLVMVGKNDPMYSTLRDFSRTWKNAGASVEFFEGEGGHGFSTRSPWLERTTERADKFLQSIGFLEPVLPIVQTTKRSEQPRSSPTELPKSSRPPNFVVILCDNLGYGDIGCFGSKLHRTPHIDRMAAEGRRFTSFYSSSGVCTPSRASLMTGCYPRRVGMHMSSEGKSVLRPLDMKGLHEDEITLAEVLRTRGYSTTIIGKWHLGDQSGFLPTRQGFDSYLGIPYSDDMTPREGLPWPPLPLMRNETVIEAPVDRDLLTKRYTEEAIHFITSNKDNSFFLYLAHAMPGSTTAPFASDTYKGKSANGAYGDSVEELDWSTGEILRSLKALGLEKDTLVIWTSDNGAPRRNPPQGSNLPLSGWGYTTMEGGMRVPCVMRWPGQIPAETVTDELATTMDLYPTLARLAGAELPLDRIIDGLDIWPLISGEPGATSPHEVFYYYHMQDLRAVRWGKWKLHLTLEALRRNQLSLRNVDPPMLYDLDNDIGESKDVSAYYPNVVARMLELAQQAREDLGDGDREGKNQRPAGVWENPKPQVLPEPAP